MDLTTVSNQQLINELLRRSEKSPDWQPIETAPLAEANNPRRVWVTRFPCSGIPPLVYAFQRKDGTWWMKQHKKLKFKPTHWLPAPQPPHKKLCLSNF